MSAPKLSSQANAGQMAAQIIGRFNATLNQLDKVLADGIPANPAMGQNPSSDAIPAADIKAALGDAAVAKIQSTIAAWTA